MPFRTTVEYAGALDPAKDKELDKLAEPGHCINSGYLFLGGIRDREYEFETKAQRTEAKRRFANVPWVLKG